MAKLNTKYNNMYTMKESIERWKSGINPNTGRRIKLWGQTWMLIVGGNMLISQ